MNNKLAIHRCARYFVLSEFIFRYGCICSSFFVFCFAFFMAARTHRFIQSCPFYFFVMVMVIIRCCEYSLRKQSLPTVNGRFPDTRSSKSQRDSASLHIIALNALPSY